MPIEPLMRFEETGIVGREQQVTNQGCIHHYVAITGPREGVCVGCKARVKEVTTEVFDSKYRDRQGAPIGTLQRHWVSEQ